MTPLSSEALTSILEPSLPPEIGCFNTGGFEFFLSHVLSSSHRYGHYAAVLMFQIKDGVGSGQGFKKLVEILSDGIRKTDCLGRLDEDTAAVLLQHATVESAGKVLNRLMSELTNAFMVDRNKIVGSCAVFPTEANTIVSLRDLAQERLNQIINEPATNSLQ
jgi:GGDEF domain-containing protein